MDGGIEQIVIVPDDEVAPVAQIQPQFKGTDGILTGSRFDGRTVQLASAVQQSSQGCFEAVVVALGKGTDFRQTNRPASLVFT